MDKVIMKLKDYLDASSYTVAITGATGCYTSTYWDFMKLGTKIIQINPGRTYFNSAADLNIRREADPVFEELMKLEEDTPQA